MGLLALLLPRGLARGVLAALLLCACAAHAEDNPWTSLEKGLDYAVFAVLQEDSDAHIVALRFDPACFDFHLFCAGENDAPSLTLAQWADKHQLVAGINASMYQPDGRTSTGYMRNGPYVNNGRVVRSFGAFFVAAPDGDDLPPAAILDRECDPWEARLPRYKAVVQSYRMISAQRRILWSPGGPLYSISAVGQDGQGRILFLHCREPIEAYSFASLLLHLPLDVRAVMYVEGGGEAGLLINSALYSHFWQGRPRARFWVTGNVNAALPNVLGVTRKETPSIRKDSQKNN